MPKPVCPLTDMEKLRPFLIDFVRIFFIFLAIRLTLEGFSEKGIQVRDVFSKQVPVSLLFALLLAGLRLIRRFPAQKTPGQGT